MNPSFLAFPGGAGVMAHHLRRYFWRELTEAQASALWGECRAQLEKMGLQETVKEAEEAESGGLDTLPRGDVLDALALLFTGEYHWPLNMTSKKDCELFEAAMRAALAKRDYVLVAL